MVARVGREGEAHDRLYVLIDENYKITQADAKMVRNLFMSGVVITNLGIEDGRLVSTNGSIDRYTRMRDVQWGVHGKSYPVILSRVEKGEELVGYTIYDVDGTLREVNIKDAVEIHKRSPFANGKLRETQNGEIISSINGKYPLRTLSIKKANEKKNKIEMDLRFVASVIGNGSNVEHAGILIRFSSAVDYTRLFNIIEKSREGLFERLQSAGVENLDPYETQRFKEGLYSVVPLNIVGALISKGGVILSKSNIPTLAAVGYDGDEVCESVIKLGKNFEIRNRVRSREDLDDSVDSMRKKIASLYK